MSGNNSLHGLFQRDALINNSFLSEDTAFREKKGHLRIRNCFRNRDFSEKGRTVPP